MVNFVTGEIKKQYITMNVTFSVNSIKRSFRKFELIVLVNFTTNNFASKCEEAAKPSHCY